MIRSNAEQEAKLRYEKMGYEVISEPGKEMIPFDLGSYIPDLLCKKGDEIVLVEVKGNVWNDSANRYKEIANTVSKQKGWKFVLLQIKDLYEIEISNSNDEDDKYVAKIRKCIESELYDAALIFAWNLLIRLVKDKYKNDEKFEMLTTDKNIINNSYSDGMISIQDYDLINDLMKKRNESVHGVLVEVSKKDVADLINLIEKYNEKWGNIIKYNYKILKS